MGFWSGARHCDGEAPDGKELEGKIAIFYRDPIAILDSGIDLERQPVQRCL
jgi:hypothetical protein